MASSMGSRCPRGWALVLAVLALALWPAGAQAEDVGCCRFNAEPFCFNGIQTLCKLAETAATPEAKPFDWLPNATCQSALQTCVLQTDQVGVGINSPGQIFVGDSLNLTLKVKNFSKDQSVTVKVVYVQVIGPTQASCSEHGVPVDVTLAPGATIEIPVVNGKVAEGTPTGRYTVTLDALDGQSKSVGGGRAVLTISQANAKVDDEVGDCLNRASGALAPASACSAEFDVAGYRGAVAGAANDSPLDFYGTFTFRNAPLTPYLAPGQLSKSWNLVIGGGACTFGSYIGGVNYVVNVEEEKYGVAGSPLRAKFLQCAGGTLNIDAATAVGWRVIDNVLEMWGKLPYGTRGHDAVVASFGQLEGQPVVIDVTPVFKIPY
jgi:hypothetical protein